MKNWRSTLVNKNTTLLETMKIIDDSSMQFAAVVDEVNNLLGTVTDGDIRRGILRGEGLDVPIIKVMNSSPISAGINNTYSDCLNLLKNIN